MWSVATLRRRFSCLCCRPQLATPAAVVVVAAVEATSVEVSRLQCECVDCAG